MRSATTRKVCDSRKGLASLTQLPATTLAKAKGQRNRSLIVRNRHQRLVCPSTRLKPFHSPYSAGYFLG